jgi:hypothetical protein
MRYAEVERAAVLGWNAIQSASFRRLDFRNTLICLDDFGFVWYFSNGLTMRIELGRLESPAVYRVASFKTV